MVFLSCSPINVIYSFFDKILIHFLFTLHIILAGGLLKPQLDLANPQHKGPWGALSPIPETNAIAVDTQGGSIYAAAGDSCAYCWDVEKSKIKLTFKGHSGYLHSVVARNSCNQVYADTFFFLFSLNFVFS
ncbi:THO complex subunit 6-like [Bidens hawaiensis]|uniref:THO complex subunit 6-like n=1 Tax=Bidens hawaiensis TaxID=980011 RepID=UPI004049C37F